MKNISRAKFDKILRLALKYHEEKIKFDAEIQKIYGGHYSDYDLNEIIDTLDYGQGSLSYECFCELMTAIKDGKGDDVAYCSSIVSKHKKTRRDIKKVLG